MAGKTVTEEQIREWSEGQAFERGKIYMAQGRVEDLSVTGTGATATVDGSQPYEVRLELTDAGMSGECSCPQGGEGAFCKHCVAVALAWLDRSGPLAMPEAPEKIGDARLRAFLTGQDHEWLADELMRAASASPVLRARLEVAAGGDVRAALDDGRLRRRLGKVVKAGRTATAKEQDERFAEIEAVLGEVSGLVGAGFAGTAAGLAEYAIDLLVPYMERDGYLVSSTLTQARRIHLEACATGHPDPVALADRLVDQALATGRLFVDALPGYAEALGTAGMARYRERVEQAVDDPDAEPATVARLRERLAEHEGGADALIALLASGKPSGQDVLRIARALVTEGRDQDAVGWIRRGLEDSPADADLRGLGAECLVRAGDRRGAVELLWPVFIGAPTLVTYRALAEAAAGHWPRWRDRALTLLRDQLTEAGDPYRFGILVEILLWEEDVEGAWQVAGAGGISENLRLRAARARAATHPADAVPLLLELAEQEIVSKRKWAYPRAAQLLAEAQILSARAGTGDDFDRHMAALRTRHKAKPALRLQLDLARLP
ncbi:SWIM zinc finger family protein [Sphaerisporangium aureirubrum]|uniref:SWIM zinc finger domain-containing protein n=1 Tax=Sphaerisporangium aureirubrum TaxID=1544736 RepID=A0ABW1NF97_9ACTN